MGTKLTKGSFRRGTPIALAMLVACESAAPKTAASRQALAVEPPVEVLEWIATHEIPISTADPSGPSSELAGLDASIGAARVVAMGEATHGTREFFQLKHRLLAHLVGDLGFSALAFEAGLPESQDVDAYVMTGRGDGERAIAGLGYWPWMTEEVRDMVEWMRTWNATHANKVHFRGIDMQVPDRALRDVLDWLGRIDPPASRQYAESLHMATSRYDFFTLDADALLLLQASAEELLARIDARRTDYTRRSSPDEWTLNRQLARVVVQCLVMSVADQIGDEWDGSNLRDASMAENVEWTLATSAPGARIAVWAHDDHVAKGHYIPEYVNMGSILAADLGADLAVVGSAFDAGEFQALGSTLTLQSFTVESGGPGTLDATFAGAGAPIAAIPLGGLPTSGPVADWFAVLPPTRSITAGYLDFIPEAYFYEMPVAEYYDAMLFVALTSRARPLRYARDQISPEPTRATATNLDLESVVDGLPSGWFVPIADEVSGYRVESTPHGAFAGLRSARIVRDRSVPGYGRNYAELRQRIDAIPYRGHRVHLSAAVRPEVHGDGRVHLFMRSGAAYDGMHDRPITHPSSWQREEIVLDIPATARTLSFGLVLVGGGAASIDDVSLTVE